MASVSTNQPGVHVHTEGVELLEAVHAVHQQHDGPAPLHRLYRPRQQVGGHGLEVLEDAHPVRVAEDFVGLVVVAVADVSGGDEHLEGILLINLHLSCLYFLVQLFHLLLPVTGEAQLLLVTPENIGSCFHRGFGQHVVKHNHLRRQQVINEKPSVVFNAISPHALVISNICYLSHTICIIPDL